MQTICLIFLPWIVYGMLSMVGWWNAAINIAISFAIEGLYFTILYLQCLFTDEEEPESAIERARRIIG